jgi:hypothetical protein
VLLGNHEAPPLVFYYDTTFNIGIHPNLSGSNQKGNFQSVFCEPIVPVAVLIHEGKRLEQHDAFFKIVRNELFKGPNGAALAKRPKV